MIAAVKKSLVIAMALNPVTTLYNSCTEERREEEMAVYNSCGER